MSNVINIKPFVVWSVNEDEEYKLALSTSSICDLEDKLCKGNSMLGLIGSQETGMPSLKTMLTVTHAAMQRFNHGVKLSDVYSAFDRYIEAGGSQVDFYADIYVGIFEASGFFQREQSAELAERREALK